MNEFTERILRRAKERERKLQDLKGTPLKESNRAENPKSAARKEVVSDSCLVVNETSFSSTGGTLKENNSEGNIAGVGRQNLKTRVSSEMPGSPHQTKTLNIQKDDFNMEIKVRSTENVRVEVEIEEAGGSDTRGKAGETPCLRENAKSRLKRLGKLYAGGEDADIPSPIHRTEADFHVDDSPMKTHTNKKEKSISDKQPRKGLSRLADLAQNINQWENDTSTPRKDMKNESPAKKCWKPKAPQPPVSPQKAGTPKKKEPAPSPPTTPAEPNVIVKATPKQLKFDRTVLEALESQGFTRTTSSSRLVYNYPQEKKEDDKPEDASKTKPPLKPTMEISSPSRRCPAIANRAALFESSPNKAKDPALLSVAERKALFEKNKGEAPVPRAAFAIAPPAKKYPAPKPPVQPKVAASGAIASKVAALFEGKPTIAQAQIEGGVREQRQKEMEQLMGRFRRNKEAADSDEEEVEASETTAMIAERSAKIVKPIAPPPMPPVGGDDKKVAVGKRPSRGDSPKVAAVLQDVKRIRVVDSNKPGRLYPCLSDIETATETETDQANSPEPDTSLDDSDSANTSFGRDILQAVAKNQTPQKRSICDDSTTASDISDVLDDTTDYLDEAAAYNEAKNASGPTPPKQGKITSPTNKGTKPSNSFSYKSFTSPSPRKSDELPAYVVDGENVLPLTHTVSFYRKQQTQSSSTPVRQITRQPVVVEEEEESADDSEAVEAKIRELMEEVNKQQLVIAQTSQALNLCNSTLEFMGSTEQVEAEKVLLLATHRRQAALNEVQRLKVEGTLRPQGQHQNVPVEKGTLEISDVTLPLKKEYVRALAAAGGKGHHVVCLVKCGEQVVATKLVSTVASNSKIPDLELKVPGSVILRNVYGDFTVNFEVYCLQAQEELLPHDVKYHINNKKPSSKLTPRKGKQESRLVKPPKESPAGPNAVRSPTFALMGFVVFSIQQISKKQWTLNKVPSMSPLEGSVIMKIGCELAVSVEHHGFLTMFEDVSGFGAWHRRWCLLKGSCLSYWKYPDDEKKLPPIDTIDLNSCATKEVGLVQRDICARPQTVLLEREREARPEDKDTLTTVCNGRKTIIRHLLSADTKEERVEWCRKINTALMALRMFGKS